jgi:hypothetical protein
MKSRFSFLAALIFLSLVPLSLRAQDKPAPPADKPAPPADKPAPPADKPTQVGKWEGDIQVPGQTVGVVVELARSSDNRWAGTIAVPSQGNIVLRMLNLKVEGAAISFDMPGAPGYPSFKGDLAADGQSIVGSFMQGGQSFRIELKRKGVATLKADASKPVVAPAVAAVKGDWAGALEVGGQTLRLKFKLMPSAEDGIYGVLDSVDQLIWIPVDSISEQNGTIKFELKLIQGSFSGKLSQDGASWEGTWEQGSGSMPLTLKRAGGAPSK